MVIGGDGGKRDCVREPVEVEEIPASRGGGDETLVAAVVVLGRPYVPAIGAVRGHVGSLGWCDVGNDTGARRC